MSRPIDADALLKAMGTWDKFGFSHSGAFVREPKNDDYVPYVHYEDMVKCVEGMPTIDAVPVVRCKDCKHYEFADNRAFGMPVKRCEWTGFEDVDDNDFCSRGERSEE